MFRDEIAILGAVESVETDLFPSAPLLPASPPETVIDHLLLDMLAEPATAQSRESLTVSDYTGDMLRWSLSNLSRTGGTTGGDHRAGCPSLLLAVAGDEGSCGIEEIIAYSRDIRKKVISACISFLTHTATVPLTTSESVILKAVIRLLTSPVAVSRQQWRACVRKMLRYKLACALPASLMDLRSASGAFAFTEDENCYRFIGDGRPSNSREKIFDRAHLSYPTVYDCRR